jgi:hypothetical protein
LPNTQFGKDPLDFYRWVFGISYQYNEYLRFAIDSQNLSFYHSQQSIPISVLKPFGYTPGGTLNGQQLPKTGSIPESGAGQDQSRRGSSRCRHRGGASRRWERDDLCMD